MDNFFNMKNSFYSFALLFLSLSVLAQSCFSPSLKMGDTKVYLKGDEVFIDYFRGPSIGIAGIGRVSWGEFSWDKVDEFVYKQAKQSNNSFLWIVVRYADEDKYGNIQLDKPITIGKVDVRESKKYVDFSHWRHDYSTLKMWEKDKAEYDADIERKTRGSSAPVFVPSYRPKSIR